jgi:hypothetical protein
MGNYKTNWNKNKDEFCYCLWRTAYHDKKCRFNCANKLINIKVRS